MVLLKRWEPFAELRRMDSEMERMWGHMFRPLHGRPRVWNGSGHMDIDVYHEEDNLVVRASMPGVNPEDVEVTVTNDALTIKGESKVEKEVKEESYLHRERRYGTFKRTVALPEGVDTEKATTSYENGVLTVTIPKIAERKPKPLKINAKPLEGKKS